LKKTISIIIICLYLTISFNVASVDNEPNQQKLTLDKGPMDSPWPMKGFNQYHTCQSPYNTVNNNGLINWKLKTHDDGFIFGGIAIDNDGVLYFGDFDWYFYAVNPDGSLKWEYKTGGPIWSTPAIGEDGTVYIGSYDAKIYAFNPDGTVIWKRSTGGSISSSPVIAQDGTIYFGTMGNTVDGCKLLAINSDGSIKWTYQAGYRITSDPAIGSDGTIYFGSLDTYFYAINPNGSLKWRYKTGDEIHSHPSIGPDGTIYFGSNDYYFYALNPNGSLKWRYNINNWLYNSAAIDNNGIIYAPGKELFAFYPDGSIKWKFDFEEDYLASSSPAISADNTIYIGFSAYLSKGGYIVAINPDGKEQWKVKIANRSAESSPSISTDGTVYIGSASHEDPNQSLGYLYAIGKGNNPPNKPTINGPTSGQTGNSYSYSISSTDEDNDQLYYYIDWGDGTNTGWKGPYNSGQTTSESHIWTSQRSYIIKAKAKDKQGLESEWSTLKVTMPKGKNLNYAIERFIDNHPIIYQLLYKITTNMQ
jgi:outer membrane protein assembly factor BamB